MRHEFLTALRFANIARSEEWSPRDGQVLSLSYRVAEITAELGELASEIKRLERHALGMAGGSSDRSKVAAEVADLLISLDALAMDLNVDLASATATKFNMTSVRYGLQTRLTTHTGEPCGAL